MQDLYKLVGGKLRTCKCELAQVDIMVGAGWSAEQPKAQPAEKPKPKPKAKTFKTKTKTSASVED